MMLFNVRPINEVYFGKTPILLEIEKLMDQFRSKYMGRYMTAIHCNNDPILLEINRLFEEQFGFGCFSLTIINQPTANAYTFPIDYSIDVINSNKKLIADKNTFRYNKNADYTCMVCIYSGLIFNSEYTTEEVVGVIMHEIGHNFYGAMSYKNTVMTNAYSIIGFIIDIINIAKGQIVNPLERTNMYRKLQQKFKRYMQKNIPVLQSVSDMITAIQSVSTTVIGSIAQLANMLTLGLLNLSISAFNTLIQSNTFTWMFTLPVTLNDEKTADNFATMYGYGPANISAINKMGSSNTKSASNIQNAYNSIPIISHIYNFNTNLALILLTTFDEHPIDISRCDDQLKMLERELNKTDLDPKMKKYLKSDIDALKSQINKLTNTDAGIKDKDIVKKAYFNALYELSDSQDFKDLLFNDINRFDDYDKTYEKKRR